MKVSAIISLMCALTLSSASMAAEVSVEEQRRALEQAGELIEARYVDVERVPAIQIALEELRDNVRGPREGAEFAALVTAKLRDVSKDGHLGLSYSEKPIAAQQDETNSLTLNDDFEQWYGAAVNSGVTRIEQHDDNIMQLDLDIFPPPAMGGDVVSAAMTVVAQADALIIDLRNNSGGAETVALVLGYLVPPGSPFMSSYHRPSESWTHRSVPEWVPGRRFGEDKPLYVLISKRTFSAGEALAYSLQAMERATIVGGQSGGGAHPFEYRRVSDHFAVDLPEAKSRHPLTGTNWQGVGVTPDIVVDPDDALEVALRLAREAIRDQSGSGSDPRSLP